MIRTQVENVKLTKHSVFNALKVATVIKQYFLIMREAMSQTFLAKAKALSRKYENPEVVETAMKRMILKTRKKLHAIYVKDLMQSLYKGGLGTADVFYLSRRLCRDNNNGINAIMRISMKEKLKNAWMKLRSEIYEEQQMWRDVKKILSVGDRI